LAVISVNGRLILIWDCLHVPALRNPLYSLRAHQRQDGCGFIGMHGLGMYVFFPSFIVKVDTAIDCHLSYAPIGRASQLSSLDYVQPVQHSTSASATAATPPSAPAVIEDNDDGDVLPDFISVKLALWLTLSKTTTSTRGISLPMPLPIVRGSPSMRALNRMRQTTALPPRTQEEIPKCGRFDRLAGSKHKARPLPIPLLPVILQ